MAEHRSHLRYASGLLSRYQNHIRPKVIFSRCGCLAPTTIAEVYVGETHLLATLPFLLLASPRKYPSYPKTRIQDVHVLCASGRRD